MDAECDEVAKAWRVVGVVKQDSIVETCCLEDESYVDSEECITDCLVGYERRATELRQTNLCACTYQCTLNSRSISSSVCFCLFIDLNSRRYTAPSQTSFNLHGHHALCFDYFFVWEKNKSVKWMNEWMNDEIDFYSFCLVNRNSANSFRCFKEAIKKSCVTFWNILYTPSSFF